MEDFEVVTLELSSGSAARQETRQGIGPKVGQQDSGHWE